MNKPKYLELVGATLLAGLTGCTLVGSQPKGVAAKGSAVASTASPAKSPATPPAVKEQGQEVTILELSGREEMGQTILDVKASMPVSQFRHFPVTQPGRIVLDIFTNGASRTDAEPFQLNTQAVSSVRLSHGDGYVRVTIDSSSSSAPPYAVTSEAGGLRLVIGAADPSATGRRDFVLVRGGKRVAIASVESKPSRENKAETAQKDEALSEAKYTGQKLSLDFKDADIKNIFRLLADVSGKNIVVTDDVNRKVTIRLVEVPWDQAMDILIQTHGLGMEEVGNVIRVSTMGRLKADRDALAASKKSGENSEELQTAYLTVNYARVVKGKDDNTSDRDLIDKVKTVLSPRGTVVADQRTNTLVVRDIKKGIEEAQSFLAKLDTRTPQILIESNLIETTPTFSRSLGIEMEGLFNDGRIRTSSRFKAGKPFDGPAQPVPAENLLLVPNTGFRLGYFGNNITGILSAAEAEGNVKIISRPSLVTLNNVESTIESSETIRVKTAAATVGESGSIQTFKAGVILTVTPQVSSDGFVLLKISVKNSAFDFSGPAPDGIPREVAREAKANVLVRDGETVVIGGIMKDTTSSSDTGVPYLRHVPILGWLFKKNSSEKNLDEMVVFITPRIIEAGAEDRPTAEQMWREQLRKTEGDKTALNAMP
jgi:type IV pilus secretin PilQ/predicted competence protein